jgi:uncharacterized protein YbbC (DUF1343 family)
MTIRSGLSFSAHSNTPGAALVEGANVSVSQGTAKPFELLGAPWMNGRILAIYLNERKISGVHFIPRDFTPSSPSASRST